MATKASDSLGVKMLLEAEKKADEDIKRARNKKQQRLKEARDEAEKEISAFKKQLDDEFEKKQKSNASSKESATKTIADDTDKKIKELENRVNQNSALVAQSILDIVCKVVPAVHTNYKTSQ
eukprot:m.22521 g.22521  ORF g.22521 m.22521 type:complete len:122 (-) comp9229_c0_seq1:392-757(-)